MAKVRHSFTSKVKEELSLISEISKERKIAILSGYVRVNGHFNILNNDDLITLQTENAKVAKYIYQLFKEIFSSKIHFYYVKNKKLNKTTSYKMVIKDDIDHILNTLGISFIENKISREVVFNDDTIAGYLCGVFLACGSLNSPNISKYHLEFCVNDEDFAIRISKLFSRYKATNFETKIIKRRKQYVVYIKKSDKIGEFLIMIGAINSCMEFENIRIDRDFINSANRLNNLDTANMVKTTNVAKKQIEWIKIIDKNLGINNISNVKIRLICQTRLENETYSLSDIANVLSNILNTKVSKSNIAHLFKKIEEMALKYEG